MIAKISTIFNSSENELWNKITEPQSLQYVSAPILIFTPKEGTSLDNEWETDKEYNLNLSFLKTIPLGSHTINLKTIDKKNNLIISNESGNMSKIWNHTIRFRNINDKQLRYTDIIEIKAGGMTFFIWLFAQVFYRHRQRRWKKLLQK